MIGPEKQPKRFNLRPIEITVRQGLIVSRKNNLMREKFLLSDDLADISEVMIEALCEKHPQNLDNAILSVAKLVSVTAI